MVDDDVFFLRGLLWGRPMGDGPVAGGQRWEDYAMYMATLGCVTGPATFHVDCAATVCAARSPKFA
eukprot:4271806-Pyramimonas_sp.AAC.1